MPPWITEVAAAHRTFAERLAERQSLAVPSEDPDYSDLGPAFPSWPGEGKDAILQPPKPEIPPSSEVLQRAVGRDIGWEVADLPRPTAQRSEFQPNDKGMAGRLSGHRSLP
jgi:hypothetical protein